MSFITPHTTPVLDTAHLAICKDLPGHPVWVSHYILVSPALFRVQPLAWQPYSIYILTLWNVHRTKNLIFSLEVPYPNIVLDIKLLIIYIHIYIFPFPAAVINYPNKSDAWRRGCYWAHSLWAQPIAVST